MDLPEFETQESQIKMVDRNHLIEMAEAVCAAIAPDLRQNWHLIAIVGQDVIELLSRTITTEREKYYSSIDLEFAPGPFLRAADERLAESFDRLSCAIAILVDHTPSQLEIQHLFLAQRKMPSKELPFAGTRIFSVALGVQNMILTALRLGYDFRWLYIPPYAHDALEGLLRIAKPWSLLALMGLGDFEELPLANCSSAPDMVTIVECLAQLDYLNDDIGFTVEEAKVFAKYAPWAKVLAKRLGHTKPGKTRFS